MDDYGYMFEPDQSSDLGNYLGQWGLPTAQGLGFEGEVNNPDVVGWYNQGDAQEYGPQPGGLSDTFKNWANTSGYRLGFKPEGRDQLATLFQGNQAITEPYRQHKIHGGNDFEQFLGDYVVPTLLGVMSGGAASAAGAGGMAAGAAGGATSGLVSSGGDPKQTAMGGLMGAVGGGLGGTNYMGIDNPYLRQAANQGLVGGAGAAVQGQNPIKGAAMAAAPGLVNYGAQTAGASMGGGEQMPSYQTDLQREYNPPTGATWSPDQYGGMVATNQYETPGGEFNTEGGNFNVPSMYGVNTLEQPQSRGGAGEFISSILSEGIPGFGGKNVPLGDAMGNLMGLYGAIQARKRAKQFGGSLSGMFGQDSPYAQNLRNQLLRRDAAGGRRSQLGPREVELQAKLAEMQSRNAPYMQQAGNAQNAADMQMYSRILGLGKLFGVGGKGFWGGQ